MATSAGEPGPPGTMTRTGREGQSLAQADGMLATGASIGQVCQKLEVAEQTYYRWRNQYGGMKASEAKRLKELETENSRLKKIVGEKELNIDILKIALGEK